MNVLMNIKSPETNWMAQISDVTLVNFQGTDLLYIDKSHKEMKK